MSRICSLPGDQFTDSWLRRQGFDVSNDPSSPADFVYFSGPLPQAQEHILEQLSETKRLDPNNIQPWSQVDLWSTEVCNEKLSPTDEIVWEIEVANNSVFSLEESGGEGLFARVDTDEGTDTPFFTRFTSRIEGPKFPFLSASSQKWRVRIRPNQANKSLGFLKEEKEVHIGCVDCRSGKPEFRELLTFTLRINLLPYYKALTSKIGKPLQVLFYGFMGTGKSSVINTLISLIQGMEKGQTVVVKSALTRRLDESLTLKLQEYKTDILNLLDTWGQALADNYKGGLRSALFEGRIPTAYDMEEATEYLRDNPNAPVVNPVDVVVFLVTPNVLKVKECTEDLEQAYQGLAASRYHSNVVPLLLLSHIDNLDEDARQTPVLSKKVEDCLEAGRTRFGIPRSDVLGIANYTVEQYRRFAIDRYALALLEAIMMHASDRLY